MTAAKPDLSKIDYPTDTLTLGELRRREPVYFEPITLIEEGFPKSRVYRAIGWQGILADKAFAERLLSTDPHPSYKREEIIVALDQVYQDWGLSAGTHGSLESIRRIETAAQEQAVRNAKGK